MSRSRQYPPLLALAAAVVLAVFTLPSSLMLPQANPAETLEYAPVPPNGGAPPGGNFSGLGLGETSTLGLNGLGGLGTPPGAAGNPSSKECLGTPPKQTEDPLAPPCVSYFAGDNGGATYTGVTRREVRVLIYNDSDFAYSDCNSNQPPANTYYDLAQPLDPTENTCITRVLRGWQIYFNQRYQTYGRFVHFYVYFAAEPQGPAQRQADAYSNFQRLHQFASIFWQNIDGYQNDYLSATAQQGVTYFTSSAFAPSSFYSRYAPRVWGFSPSLEEQAASYASFICRRVAPYPAHFSGNPLWNGQERVYGLVETTDPKKPQLRQFQDLVASEVQRCGVTFQDVARYPVDGLIVYSGPQSRSYSTYAAPAMSQFQRDGITTIIWPGGFENQFSQAAAKTGYYPEWITGGDGLMDGFDSNVTQDQTVWSHAMVVTPLTRLSGAVPDACRDAYLSAVPSATPADITYACQIYPSLRQLFIGIQVAGPRLTPAGMDSGFHAIPPHPSSDPQQPACFYDPGDYTCVKDATAMWWNPAARNAIGSSGCWAMPDQGARYLTARWPSSPADSREQPADPCNGYGGGIWDYVDSPGTG